MPLRIVLHNAVSADGRITGFVPDMAQYYGLARRWKEDATLVGSGTLLKPIEEVPPETPEDLLPVPKTPGDKRPLLVVPDSRGRVRIWHALRRAGYWRGFVALCSEKTPKSYLAYLRKRGVEYLIAGRERVDLKKALERLGRRCKLRLIRVDSGGTLNGLLLREGLVSEISLVVHPALAGGRADSLIKTPELGKGIVLKTLEARRLKNGLVWLRFGVR
ncbi:MAG TPA: deaminase [Elusimicrobia bacterium]|nr:deaminase [Elusimicrobiota bacterium]